MSQTDAILQYLQTGAVITPLNALKICGTLRLSERIRELEKDGVPIERVWYQADRKTRVMSYKLGRIAHG